MPPSSVCVDTCQSQFIFHSSALLMMTDDVDDNTKNTKFFFPPSLHPSGREYLSLHFFAPNEILLLFRLL